MARSISRNGGFTLIELLIVIAVIGILAVAFLPSILGAPAKARDAQRIEDVNKIADLLTVRLATEDDVFPVDFNCIDPATGLVWGDLARDINNNHLADFGGTFPKDPDPDNQTYPSSDWCAGHYIIIDWSGMAGWEHADPFIWTHLENDESGNSANPVAVTPSIPILSDSGEYYVVFIQK